MNIVGQYEAEFLRDHFPEIKSKGKDHLVIPKDGHSHIWERFLTKSF